MDANGNTLEELLDAGEVSGALLLSDDLRASVTPRELDLIRQAFEAGLRIGSPAKSVSTENAVSRVEGADQIRTGVRDRSTVPAGTSPFDALHRTRRTAEVLLASKRHASVALSAAGRDLIRDHERLIAVAEAARVLFAELDARQLKDALARLDFGDGA